MGSAAMLSPLVVVLDQAQVVAAERWLLPHLDAPVTLVGADQRRGEFREALESAHAVICNELTAGETRCASQLRAVLGLGAGVNRIQLEALPAGCVLCSTHGHERAIAELVFMGMISAARRLIRHDSGLRHGRWYRPRAGQEPDADLDDHTLGLIGLGPIGLRVAQLGQAFGMRTIAVTRSPDPVRAGQVDALLALSELDHLFAASDFIVVSIALTAETKHLVTAEHLRLLGPTGVLVNVARGPIVIEDDLYDALAAGNIGAAALDVWYSEPDHANEQRMPATRPFWELDNVVHTPHFAGLTAKGSERRWAYIAKQLERLAAGQSLASIVAVGSDPNTA